MIKENYNWLNLLSYEEKELLQQSLFLIKDMKNHQRVFFDYSFITMPAAKAYEGFIKDVLYKLSLISDRKYLSLRFRVGKSLNPELDKMKRYKKEALFNEISAIFGGNTIAFKLWEIWKKCRNQVFHYFPGKSKNISLDDAEMKVENILSVIKTVLFHPNYQKVKNKALPQQIK